MAIKRRPRMAKIYDNEIEQARNEYVHSIDQPSIRALAKKYNVNYNYLRKLASERNPTWVMQREKFWHNVYAKSDSVMANETARSIVLANKHHIRIGKELQETAMKILESAKTRYDDNPDNIKIGEALRVATQMARAGIDAHRKGLGLDDVFVHVLNVREIATEVIQIIANHVTDPDVLENIVHDISHLRDREEQRLRDELPVKTEFVQ